MFAANTGHEGARACEWQRGGQAVNVSREKGQEERDGRQEGEERLKTCSGVEQRNVRTARNKKDF